MGSLKGLEFKVFYIPNDGEDHTKAIENAKKDTTSGTLYFIASEKTIYLLGIAYTKNPTETVTLSEYNSLVENDTVDENILYLITADSQEITE